MNLTTGHTNQILIEIITVADVVLDEIEHEKNTKRRMTILNCETVSILINLLLNAS